MKNRWGHQTREITEFWNAPARAFNWSPRSGKTRGVVGQCDRLVTERGVQRILVIAPKMVHIEGVWESEFSDLYTVIPLYSGALTARRITLRTLCGSEKVLVVLVNWDTLSPLIDDLVKWNPQVVIADESHFAKSAGSARSRALHRLGKTAKYRRALSGTIAPKDYIDLYSQYKFLDSKIFGTRKADFLERYVETDMFGGVKYYKNLPELRTKMLSIMSVFDRKTEWNDQPPQLITRNVELPAKASKLYDQLVKDKAGEWDEFEIDASHKLSQIGKLQQLTAGFIQTEEGVKWIHKQKIEATVEELRDILAAGEKAIVYYHFAPEGDELEKAIREEYGPIVGRIGGKTNMGLRKSIQDSFLDPLKSIRVVVVQDSLGIGITLHANYTIRTSYPLAYDKYDQSNERGYIDSDQNRTFIDIHVPNSIDNFARRICLNKEQALKVLVGLNVRDIAYGEQKEAA